MAPLNECASCGADFSSLRNFDKHRVGVHEYTYSEGLKMEPMREDGRRCLDVDELDALGLIRDKHGRWADPLATSKARDSFGRSLRRATQPVGGSRSDSGAGGPKQPSTTRVAPCVAGRSTPASDREL